MNLSFFSGNMSFVADTGSLFMWVVSHNRSKILVRKPCSIRYLSLTFPCQILKKILTVLYASWEPISESLFLDSFAFEIKSYQPYIIMLSRKSRLQWHASLNYTGLAIARSLLCYKYWNIKKRWHCWGCPSFYWQTKWCFRYSTLCI